jgi:AP-2 complex subunit alpha
MNLLGRFIGAKEHSNIRYLALSAMSKLASLDSETASLLKKHQETVMLALRDPDISIRKRALGLLYGMCDKTNAKSIGMCACCLCYGVCVCVYAM